MQARSVEREDQSVHILAWHVDDEEILHVGGAEFAGRIFFGEGRGGVHLRGGDASAENGSAHVVEARLLLGMDADVVAVGIRRRVFRNAWVEIEAEAGVEFAEETLGGPTVLGEEMLQARAIAILAEAILVAKNFCDGSDDRDHLIVMNKSIETGR